MYCKNIRFLQFFELFGIVETGNTIKYCLVSEADLRINKYFCVWSSILNITSFKKETGTNGVVLTSKFFFLFLVLPPK